MNFVEFPYSMEKLEFNNVFGKFVKFKRTEKGWSQSELASKIGHNSQNVSRMERGKISPTLYWCYEILAPAFEMDLMQFLTEFEIFRKNS